MCNSVGESLVMISNEAEQKALVDYLSQFKSQYCSNTILSSVCLSVSLQSLSLSLSLSLSVCVCVCVCVSVFPVFDLLYHSISSANERI